MNARALWPAPAGAALAVGGTALFFHFGFSQSFAFPKLLVLCAGVWLAAAGVAASKGRTLERTSLDLPLAGWLLVLALGSVWSEDRWLSVLGWEASAYGLWPAAALAALYWLAVQAVPGRETGLLRVALAAYGLVGFYAVLQAAGLEVFANMPPLPNGRAYATLGSPVALGQAMALVLPLALYQVRERRGEATGWICLAAITGGLLASVSRGAWLSAAVACGLYLASGKGRLQALKSLRRLALAALAVMVLGAAFAWTLRRRPIAARDGGRALIWRSAWDLFKERPLLGWGTNSFNLTSRVKLTPEAIRLSSVKEIPSHAHNDLLQALATTGALGLAAYLWLCAAVARAALRAGRDPARPWAGALACGLLGLFLNMKVNAAPLEALATAALFSALLADRRPAAGSGRGWSFLALAAASASLLLAGRLAAAEIAMRSAERFTAARRFDLAARESERAVRYNPWQMRYRMGLVNALARLSARMEPPSSRNAEVLEAALASAREGAAMHPRDPDAHYAEGIALLNLAFLEGSLRGAVGDLGPARAALDRSLALDATYIPTLQARRAVAETQRDAGMAAELTRRIQLIQDRPEPMKESVQGSDSFTRP